VKDTEINLTQAIDQLRDFLGVVGLVALLLGGIGVASGVHAFVMRKIDTVAVLRCLGATSWQVLAIYVVQAALMGLIGAALGGLLGIGFQLLLPLGLQDFLPVDVSVHLAPASIGLGLVVGVWVALVFALRPLIALRRISPLQALRREADAVVLRLRRLDPLGAVVSLAIVGSIVLLAVTRAGNVRRGIGFSVAIMLAVGALFGTAVVFSSLARRLVRPRWPFVLRQGIASLYRPGNQTRAVVLSLGFGVFLMSTLYQVHNSLLKTLDVKLTQARANLVFFDVQQDQDAGIDSIIRALPRSTGTRRPSSWVIRPRRRTLGGAGSEDPRGRCAESIARRIATTACRRNALSKANGSRRRRTPRRYRKCPLRLALRASFDSGSATP
jgi:putative ABC transport system permease protein